MANGSPHLLNAVGPLEQTGSSISGTLSFSSTAPLCSSSATVTGGASKCLTDGCPTIPGYIFNEAISLQIDAGCNLLGTSQGGNSFTLSGYYASQANVIYGVGGNWTASPQ